MFNDMDDTTTHPEVQVFDLVDSLDQSWLKLPLEVMKDVGPATQTLGGLLKITNKETFVSTATIAEAARMPPRTAEKHLHSLDTHGWVSNRGRAIHAVAGHVERLHGR